jgi:ADP-heptose:LPS heptosyltransferase
MIEAIAAAREAKRILIVKTSSLGDVCNALPVADVIRHGRPNTYLGWVIKEPFRSIIDVNPNVDTTFSFTPKDLWSAIKVGLEARKVKYEVALDLQSLFVSSIVSRLSGARTRIGYNTRKEFSHWFLTHPIVDAAKRKAVDLMLDFPKALGIETSEFRPQSWLGSARRHDADLLMTIVPKPYAALCVGASVPQRQWSHQRWGRLADRLSQEGITPVFVGTPHDQGATVSARNVATRTTYSVVGRTDLLTLASIIAGSAVVIASDSGPLHLATAVGTPVVGLFGPTDPMIMGPWGTSARTVYVKQQCSPCNRTPTCGGTFFCMAAIEVEMVMEQVLGSLRNETKH